MPFSIACYSPKQSRIHRPSVRWEITYLFICSFIFCWLRNNYSGSGSATLHITRIRQKGNAKVVAAGLGMYLNAALAIAARMIWRKLLEEHPFWEDGGLMWCERIIIHFSQAYSPPSICSSIHPFLPIIQAPKCLVEHGIESVSSPNKQQLEPNT